MRSRPPSSTLFPYTTLFRSRPHSGSEACGLSPAPCRRCLQTLEADRGSTLIRELVLDLKSHHERRQQYCQGTPSARSPFHRAPHRTKTDPYAHPTLRRVPAPATCMRSCQRCCPGWSAIRRTSLLASPKG